MSELFRPKTLHEACAALEAGHAVIIPDIPGLPKSEKKPLTDVEKTNQLLLRRAELQQQIDDINDQIDQIYLDCHPRKKRCDFIFSEVSGGCTLPVCRIPAGATCPRPECVLNGRRS